MFTINLEKKLVAAKRVQLQDDLALKEANKILNSATKEDLEVLQRMGQMGHVEKKGKIEEREKRMQEFDPTRVFSRTEIKKLCCKYGLRFLDITKYKGTLDTEMPRKVREFEAKYNNHFLNSTYYNSTRAIRPEHYMVCAPKESFNLSERPIDPLLFYPINDFVDDLDEQYYYLIHKWGSDISFGRFLKNIPKRNGWNLFLTWVIAFALITWFVVVPIFLMFPQNKGMDLGTKLFITGIGAFFGMIIYGASEGYESANSNKWNSEFKDDN